MLWLPPVDRSTLVREAGNSHNLLPVSRKPRRLSAKHLGHTQKKQRVGIPRLFCVVTTQSLCRLVGSAEIIKVPRQVLFAPQYAGHSLTYSLIAPVYFTACRVSVGCFRCRSALVSVQTFVTRLSTILLSKRAYNLQAFSLRASVFCLPGSRGAVAADSDLCASAGDAMKPAAAILLALAFVGTVSALAPIINATGGWREGRATFYGGSQQYLQNFPDRCAAHTAITGCRWASSYFGQH